MEQIHAIIKKRVQTRFKYRAEMVHTCVIKYCLIKSRENNRRGIDDHQKVKNFPKKMVKTGRPNKKY